MVNLEALDAKLDALLERTGTADRRFLTVDSAAAYCDLSPESIRRLLASGKLTALRAVRGRVLIDRNQLDSYVLGCDSRPRSGRGRQR